MVSVTSYIEKIYKSIRKFVFLSIVIAIVEIMTKNNISGYI
jgi:hypothetical protein